MYRLFDVHLLMVRQHNTMSISLEGLESDIVVRNLENCDKLNLGEKRIMERNEEKIKLILYKVVF